MSGGNPVGGPKRNPAEPIPSLLRPHCPARERIILWVPALSSRDRSEDGRPQAISNEDVERIKTVTTRAWVESTAQTYGTGLLTFHVFCDIRRVPDAQRAPAAEELILSFIAALAGSYSATAIDNYVAGTALVGAGQLAPTSSKRCERKPITLATLEALRHDFNLSLPLDAAVWACACVAFFSLARLGELTVQNQKAFKPAQHPSRSNVRSEVHRDGSQVTVIHLPRTKSASDGEDISFARSNHCADPAGALKNHLEVNALPDSCHLFAYRKQPSNAIVPLTRSAMLKRVQGAAKKTNAGSISGHSFRIGGTLEYLLRGLTFEAVKALGRWKSDTFTLYLRKHAQVLAPYMQDNTEALGRLSQLSIQLPPVR
ncbi:hypothetical protein C8Q77DRAFT_1220680 [Trametes polyzona]|nr:hypothetical protein C8Q77DRAFT_1220680 [Trametes polyzona]